MTTPIGISLPLALLREEAPDLILRPGMTLMARVVERHEGRGVISMANALLVAELPEQVRKGDTLRLRVHDTTAEQVTMRLLETAQQAQQQAAPPPVVLPLPGEPRLRVADEDPGEGADGGDEPAESVALVYESPRLGPLDLRLELREGAVRAIVGARAGEPHEIAASAADELRDALATVTGKPADVRVEERRDPLDVYA
jgi:hypothetical protein